MSSAVVGLSSDFALRSLFASGVVDVLAAGTALGYVGEWEQSIAYLDATYNSMSLGQVRGFVSLCHL